MSRINFSAKITSVNDWTIIRLPKTESSKLPSRGMVMAEGTINDLKFQRELEPDGKGSHWLRLDSSMLKGAKAKIGDMVGLSMEPSKEWPEPSIPQDLKTALSANPTASKTWQEITPMARWDWIRWIAATKNPSTRKIRIEKTFGKFASGIRRPCCFNRTECTVQEVSHRGVLLDGS